MIFPIYIIENYLYTNCSLIKNSGAKLILICSINAVFPLKVYNLLILTFILIILFFFTIIPLNLISFVIIIKRLNALRQVFYFINQ